ncbi:MAG: CopG family transcriptional regulator [Brachybacterium sp.]|uniref:CopG family transcriptional regulator n=1 Tax=Brachybacterium sp. TaxID=1891286 RepID=UPI002647CAF3|nr:CopG family transcriptional regulator [Brachybacterium sp.]MDN5686419.1 CopG family transcriptional regulator [Brachybacterium sp.]
MAMTLRLSDADEKTLADLARQEGISRQEATVRAIRETAARRGHQQAVSELSERARTRYAELLDRLAQ